MLRRLLIRETLRATFSYPRIVGISLMFWWPAWVLWRERGWWAAALLWVLPGFLLVRFTLTEDEIGGADR